MNLTSFNRLRFVLGGSQPLSDNIANKSRFLTWIPTISARIEDYLDRSLELVARTEYADALPETLEYWMKATPIISVASVKSDSEGLFDGSETSEVNWHIGKDQKSVVLQTSVTPAIRGLQFVYTGGLATHGTRSIFELENEGAAPFVAGKYVEGLSSGAVGLVTDKTGTALTIDVSFGVFEDGESIKGKVDWNGADVANMTADIASVTSRSLAESHSAIVEACELEMRYYDDHRSDYENSGTTKGTTTRRSLTEKYDLLPEVKALIKSYVNWHI